MTAANETDSGLAGNAAACDTSALSGLESVSLEVESDERATD